MVAPDGPASHFNHIWSTAIRCAAFELPQTKGDMADISPQPSDRDILLISRKVYPRQGERTGSRALSMPLTAASRNGNGHGNGADVAALFLFRLPSATDDDMDLAR